MTGIGAVVVDYNVGPALRDAVQSLLDEAIEQVVVVENGVPGSSASALGPLAEQVTIVATGENLGFGAGVNRGVAALSGELDSVIVANPDSIAHPGAVAELGESLDAHPSWVLVGPTIITSDGALYPSIRRFPSPLDAAGHALLGLFTLKNPFSVRYLSQGARSDGGVDWVSGAFFLVLREAFETVGGFDESFFMFAEDMDLCWRLHEAGYGVGVAPSAMITHAEGVARRAHPYRMVVAHHRSALRFAAKTTRGPARALLPLAAAVLGLRLVAALVTTALKQH
jgi:N-acetylglucosaminyl-diphospho-decaprenol L-rhamnosyltransferase